jgi:hypothetical protein
MIQEHDHEPALLNLADMMGPVSHELRNVFNNMVLSTAILARTIPEEHRNQVAEFRALALRANEMLTMLDHHRQRIVAMRRPMDLNEVVEEAAQRCQANGVEVAKKLASGLPQVWGNQGDMSRLIELLVKTCRSPRQVQTCRNGAAVELAVMGGPLPTTEPVEKFFDPFGPSGSAQSHLDRAACQTIARRLGAPIRTKSSEGGIAVVIDFEPAN